MNVMKTMKKDGFTYTIEIYEKRNKLFVKLSMKNLTNEIKRFSYGSYEKTGLNIQTSENFKNFFERKIKFQSFYQYKWFLKLCSKFQKNNQNKPGGAYFLSPNEEVKRTISFKKIKELNEKVWIVGSGYLSQDDLTISLFEKEAKQTTKVTEKEGVRAKIHIEEDSKWVNIKTELTNTNEKLLWIYSPHTSHPRIYIRYPTQDKEFIKEATLLNEYGFRIIKSIIPSGSYIPLRESDTFKKSVYYEKLKPISDSIPIEIGATIKRDGKKESRYLDFFTYEVEKDS